MSETRTGATLPLVVFSLAALLGMAALAIDVALMTLARQRAQNVADAAALAGAVAGAQAARQVIAANNAAGSTFGGVSVTTGTGGAVTVTGYVNAPLAFAPAVGYAPQSRDGLANTLSVPAGATAAANLCGLPPGSPVAPFGVIGDDPSNSDPAVAYVAALLSGAKTVTPGVYQPAGAQVTLKLNAFDNTGRLALPGSFDPLLTSGSGATYLNTIRQTSDQTLTVGQTIQCAPLTHDFVYYNTIVDYNRQYIAARFSPSNTAYSHAYATYDAWFNAGSPEMPAAATVPEDHLLIVPVVSQSAKNQLAPVAILAFAIFFVDQPYPTSTPGNGIALGRFLGLTVPSGSGGACSGAGGKAPPRLTQ